MDDIKELLKSHYTQGLLLMMTGLVLGWLLGRWRRHRLKKQVFGGDIRDVLTIQQILLRDHPGGGTPLRIRSCGSAPLGSILTNPLAHEAFLKRAARTTAAEPLLNLKDKMGSYLLHLLQPWVCGTTWGGP